MANNNKKNIFNNSHQSIINISNEKSYSNDNALYNTLLVDVTEAKVLLKNKQAFDFEALSALILSKM